MQKDCLDARVVAATEAAKKFSYYFPLGWRASGTPFDDDEDRRKCRGQKYHCDPAGVITCLTLTLRSQ
jgi:hypothetical protein